MKNTKYLQPVATFIRKFPLLLFIPYYLYRFFQTKYTIGVVGIVFNDEGKILLVEHVFHPKIPWGLPGGWLGFNENPVHAVEREIYEELGLVVSVVHTVKIEMTHYNHIDIAYLCESRGEIQQLSYELLNYNWHTLSELPQLHSFHRAAIEDAAKMMEREMIV